MRFSFQRENAREAENERLVESGELITAKFRERALKEANRAMRKALAALEAWEAADKAHQEALAELGVQEDPRNRKTPLFDSKGRMECKVCGYKGPIVDFATHGEGVQKWCKPCEARRSREHSARSRAKVKARLRSQENWLDGE